MAKITRQGSNAILSSAVEYHNFVFLAGMTADDLSLDITGQTKQVLEKISAALEANGTDNTRLLNAQIWLKDIRDRDAMNKVWVEWLGDAGRPARACVEANMADPRHRVEIMVNACR
jgi:enamine deaminase RidA (YjgF/YER057c/UK114 family)